MLNFIPSEPTYTVKLLILGDATAGKTSMLLRWTDDIFSLSQQPTIGIDFRVKNIKIQDKTIKVQVWDTAGQERYRVITKTLYQGTMGILLAYDSTSEMSFHNIRNWVFQINTHACKHVRKVLISTKNDLPNKIISTKRGKKLAKEFNMFFYETSAKNNINVNESFANLTEAVVNENIPVRASIIIQKNQSSSKKKSCCQ